MSCRRNTIILVILILLLTCTACSYQSPEMREDEKKMNNDSENSALELEFSAWLAYWDTERVELEVESGAPLLDNLMHFAAYFDKDGDVFVPENTSNMHKRLNELYGEGKFTDYLTIVNDKKNEEGPSSLKDTSLLYDLVGSDDQILVHVNELIQLTLDHGYDGLEIDYEAIRGDVELWTHFSKFVRELWNQASEHDIELRIVLEPNAPIGTIDFPNGPEYIMMCYNLYGLNTIPGPKADRDFILKMIDKMELLESPIGFAFATGGFDWTEDKAQSITEIEANDLIRKYSSETRRDDDSKALYFSYIEENGTHHVVWFADELTIAYWMSIPISRGHGHISLWRVGGNELQSLRSLGESKDKADM